MEFITNSPEETEKIGEALAKSLQPGTILAYRGDLGAGKTAFTRGLARGLGCKETVTSPTYTIVNEYLGGRLPLFHFAAVSVTSSTVFPHWSSRDCAMTSRVWLWVSPVFW